MHTANNRTRLGELLAASDPARLIDLAERALDAAGEPVLIRGPETGSLVMTVREPVESTRFQLGDVLVTHVELEHRGERGWAMRLGDDQIATLAAAICDAEAASHGPSRDEILALAGTTERELAAARRREWAELEPTTVAFEEMDA